MRGNFFTQVAEAKRLAALEEAVTYKEPEVETRPMAKMEAKRPPKRTAPEPEIDYDDVSIEDELPDDDFVAEVNSSGVHDHEVAIEILSDLIIQVKSDRTYLEKHFKTSTLDRVLDSLALVDSMLKNHKMLDK